MNASRLIVSAMSSGCGGTPASCTRLDSLVSAAFALLAWIVVTPPGWPVFHALSSASASAPRTSPMIIRSGRSRMVVRTSRVMSAASAV